MTGGILNRLGFRDLSTASGLCEVLRQAGKALPSSIWRIILAGAFITCAIVVLSRGLGGWLADYDGWVCRQGDYHVDKGEALIHAIDNQAVAFCMPGYSVPNALLCNHVSATLQMMARSLSLLVCAILVFGLGRLLHSGVCGSLATLLFALVVPPSLSSERWLYTLHVLLVAYVLVWRAKAPSMGRSLLLGLAVGLSLLILSPLFLFPLTLAVYEWVSRRFCGTAGMRGWRRQIVGMFLVVLVCLAPWTAMNWRLSHKVIPFEDGRARHIIIAGAQGVVSPIGNDTFWPRASPSRDPIPWASREVLSHPLRYLRACWRRLLFAASPLPILFLSGLAAAWIFRRREEYRQLALLAGYFIGIHCLLAVVLKYFEPVLPLLSVLGAAAALSWLKPTAGRSGGHIEAGTILAVLAPLLLLHLYVVGLVASYPSRVAREAPFERELTKYPADPGLWSESGLRSLVQGQAYRAAKDLAKALSLSPQRPEWRMKYAWTRMVLGGAGADAWNRFHPGRLCEPAAFDRYAFRALYSLRHGRRAEAQEALDLMRDIWRSFPGSYGERQDVIAGGRDGILAMAGTHVFDGVLPYWPPWERRDLMAALGALAVGAPVDPTRLADAWMKEAVLAKRSGQGEAALEALARAERLCLDAERTSRVSRLYQDWGEPVRSMDVQKSFLMRCRRGDVGLLLDLADKAWKDGRKPFALEVFAAAENIGLDAEQARRAASLCRDWGELQRAVGLIRGLPQSRPQDFELLREIVVEAKRMEKMELAQETLLCAGRRKMDFGQRRRWDALARSFDNERPDAVRIRRIVELYRRWGAPSWAARLAPLYLTLGRRPQEGGLLLALAEAAVEAGKLEPASDLIAQARERRLSAEELGRLAMVYQALREYPPALEVLDRLVREHPAQARWRNDRGVLKLLMGRREEAVQDLERAVSLAPESIPAYLSLGSLYASSGRRTAASKLYEKALRQPLSADPHDEEIRDRIRVEYGRPLSPGKR